MREDFLHYLWRMARFDLRRLRTTEDEPIVIQQLGTLNTNAGPDFDDSRLRIGDMLWAGKVEIHVKSSEWYAHGHDDDPAYDGVILHVVLEEDQPVLRRDGSRIPCLELKGRIPAGIRNTYWRLMHNEHWVPCQNQLGRVDESVKAIWLQRLLAERLSTRAERFSRQLEISHRDWEEAFYRAVARSMGGRVNADAMEMLAASVPLRILLKHKHSLLQLESLLFGQSGLLPEQEKDEEPYVTLLRREYCLLRTKYELRPLPVTAWRFLRMRPNNFPTIRIAQLACLLHRSGQLFGKALAASNGRELKNMFDVSLSNYWRDHYKFGPGGHHGERRLGGNAIRSILINAVAPAYFTYAKLRDDDRYHDRAIDLLQALPPEQNQIIRKWKQVGWKADSAGESQALLELKNNYCDKRRCTACAIGCALLGKHDEDNLQSPPLIVEEEELAYG